MELIKKQTVGASAMGANGKLSVLGIFQAIQDAVTELMGDHKIDGFTVKREYGALWVFVKTRVKFLKELAWREIYTVTAFISHISVAKMNIDVQIENAKGELAVCSRTEICALDIASQRIRKLSTVGVNNAMLSDRTPNDIQFSKFETDDLPLAGSVQIKSTNIDFSHHTNNTEYVRIVLNSFSVAETEAMPVKEMEMIYSGQSYENEILNVRKTATGNNCFVVLEKDGSPVVKCEIVC